MSKGINKIYSNRCWVDHKIQPATICFEDGIITDIWYYKDNNATDYQNLVIMPGVIDVHVHVNEPGRTEWEGFDSATKAAAAGGTTTIVDMPLNASPVTTTAENFEKKVKASNGKLNVNCGFYGGLIPGNSNNLVDLIKKGVFGIKCFLTHSGIDEFPNVTEKDLEEAMPILEVFGTTLLVHCELDDGFKNDLEENSTSYKSYLESRPEKWETDAINMMIRLCRKFNCPVHIVHVSSADALVLLEKAKSEGLPVTAETCVQYLIFNADEIPDANTMYKCAPPIRGKTNNEKLKMALSTGVLDFITTDHSPAPPSMKEMDSGNFKIAWGGISGIQFLLAASWTSLFNIMNLEQFIPLLTEKPAKFIHLDHKKGKLAKGFDADITIWNPEAYHKYSAEDILFRHKISPYIGTSLWGKVYQTFVNGVSVYENDKIINTNKGLCLTLQSKK